MRYFMTTCLMALQLLLGSALLAAPVAAQEAEAVNVGLLRFTSSGPVFLALEHGYFRDEGLDVAITPFQDAPSVAAAAAGGDVTFGVTALTAALFNLASQGRLKIIAGQAQEKKGYSGNLVLVTKSAHDQGADTLAELFARPFGLTQLGSPSHYQLGQLAEAHGVAAADLNILSFQTLPNLVAALTSGGADWAIIAPPIATDLIESGAVVALAPYSDYGSYQFGGVFAAGEVIEQRTDMVRRFLRAYAKGLVAYSTIITDPASNAARAEAEIVARHVYPDMDPAAAAAKVLGAALYVDPTGQIDVADVGRQIAWYSGNGLLKTAPEVESILRLDLLP